MANYTTSDVATLPKNELTTILNDNGLPVTGTVAELRARIVEEEVAMNATPNPTPTGSPVIPITGYDVALNARSYASPNATGAENAPLRTYVFAVDNLGQPKLIGGTWIAGAIVSDKYAALKGSDGNELAVQPDYIGREKSVKFVICDNATGSEYRLSGSSFEAAHKAAGTKMSFAAREMSQTVVEVGGYPRATVVLA